MDRTTGVVSTVIGAALGGAWGGAVVGLVEAALITLTSGPADEYWLFPYAIACYGLVGAALGFGYAVIAVAVAAVVKRASREAFGSAAALGLFLLGSAVTRYHVAQRVFHEQLVTLSATGAAVHVGVIVLVGGVALLMLLAGRVLQRTGRELAVGAMGLMLCWALSAGAAALATSPAAAPAIARTTGAAAKGHPNVVLIIVDTLRPDALGVYGGRPAASPAIDRFAATAVRFENTFAQSTWTRPSIATLLTSLYPSTHGAVHKMDPLPDHVTTLAEALRAKGYWTAGFVSNINVAPVFNFQQGFEEYAYLPPAFYFGATDSATRLAIYKGLRVVRERFFGHRMYVYHYYQDAEVVNDAVLKWLQQRPPAPFFLLMHYMDPHDPYLEIPYNGAGVARVTTPNPPADRKDELRRLYDEGVTYLDRHLDAFFSRLKELGLYDDSIIALTADHGEEFQDHGGWWHGTTLYQEQLHVPLIVKRAQEPRGGETESRTVGTLDVAPTLMAAAGLAPPAAFAGRDLFAPTTGEPEPLFAEEDLEGNVLASLRVGAWKIITANPNNPRGLGTVELYDLSQDSAERRNLAGSEPERTAEMLRRLNQERERIARRRS